MWDTQVFLRRFNRLLQPLNPISFKPYLNNPCVFYIAMKSLRMNRSIIFWIKPSYKPEKSVQIITDPTSCLHKWLENYADWGVYVFLEEQFLYHHCLKLNFKRFHSDWSVEIWRTVLFSDKSKFNLFNRDAVWCWAKDRFHLRLFQGMSSFLPL